MGPIRIKAIVGGLLKTRKIGLEARFCAFLKARLHVALEAILDRLIHGAIRLKLEGESMRKKRVQTKGVDSH